MKKESADSNDEIGMDVTDGLAVDWNARQARTNMEDDAHPNRRGTGLNLGGCA